MFGLEDQKKKKKGEDFVFELEKDIKNSTKNKELQQKILARMQTIKDLLQSGIEKSDFDVIGRILYGYSSLLKVVQRTPPKG